MSRRIVEYYEKEKIEDARLSTVARFEFVRTKEIIGRYLTAGPLVIADVAGATGAYAFWLAGLGHRVHLRDLVPAHIETARARARELSIALESMEIGDARSLPYPDGFADLVLLMGPLYHLQERADRERVLRESARVLKPGGRVFCAAISRFGSLFSGFQLNLLDDPRFEAIVDRDLRDGRHENIAPDKDYWTTAYFHQPAELREEIVGAGLACEKLIGVEGPVGLMSELNGWLDRKDACYEFALKYMKRVEEEESLLGASYHLLAIAKKG
jgi:ubiquinone/menaquinone biosynthesis C-methylase UbiE